MLDPIRAKMRALGITAGVFVGGVLLASGLEWTAGSYASSLLQNTPVPQDVRPMAELSESFISISEAITPAVVSIRVEKMPGTVTRRIPQDIPEQFRRYFPPDGDLNIPPQGPIVAGGTGFIISEDGYILTNNHVVADADVITVVTQERREYPAELIGRDPMTDIAVIRINGQGLPRVRFGDPENTRVGEWVLAIGNPLGLNFTVTAGIVSAKNRSIDILQENIADEEMRQLAIESFIQTDAAINPGNSGGPLVNIRGEVVGVNTAIASNTGLSQGYGFAVPIDLARHVAEDLIRYGRWRRAVLGVRIDEVYLADVEAFDLPAVAGAVIQGFSIADTPAQRAGLRQGDVIVGVDGQRITEVNELQRLIASRTPGDRVRLDVIRYGERMEFDVQLMEAPTNGPVVAQATPRPTPDEGRLGISVAPLDAELADTYGYSTLGGIVINELSPTGALAERFPYAEGFKIVSVDGAATSTVEQFEATLRQKAAGSVVSFLLEAPDGAQRIINVLLPA